MEINNNILLLIFASFFILLILIKRNNSEKFCKVAPRFDRYYQDQIDQNVVGRNFKGDYQCSPDCNCAECYGSKKENFSLKGNSSYYAKDGVAPNSDTIGSPNSPGCKTCGGDYISAAPKRDRYYQMNQGYLGDDLLSGYPYYSAMGGAHN